MGSLSIWLIRLVFQDVITGVKILSLKHLGIIDKNVILPHINILICLIIDLVEFIIFKLLLFPPDPRYVNDQNYLLHSYISKIHEAKLLDPETCL